MTSNQSGVSDEMSGQDVDMELRGFDVGVFARDLPESLIPERHRMNDPVDLGRGSDVLALALRQIDRVPHDAVAAPTWDNRLLDGEFVGIAGVDMAANLRIFTFGIFAHHAEVDIVAQGRKQNAIDTGQGFDGTKIDVLVEAPTDRKQKLPQRYVVGNAGTSDCAEIDGVVMTKLLKAILRHHAASFHIAFATPVKMGPLERKAVPPAGCFKNFLSSRYDLVSNAVAGYDRDFVLFWHSKLLFGYLPRIIHRAPLRENRNVATRGLHSSQIERIGCFSLEIASPVRRAYVLRQH